MRLAPADIAAIADAVERGWQQEVAFLAELVRTPSDNPPGDLTAIAETVATGFERLGLTAERHPVPAELAARHGLAGVVNVVARRRFGDGPTVALNAHGDVVPPGDGWSHPPYGAEVVDGTMYGRGVAVSKSDIACYAFALQALAPLAGRLAGTVELHATFDEETGGAAGPGWLLAEGISRPDLCISAGLGYAVVTQHNGCLHLEVAAHGRSAHAAAPETGADAIAAIADVLAVLYAERMDYPMHRSKVRGIGHPNLTVGLISGGINTNVVADRCTLRLDRRMTPEEAPEAVEARLRSVIAAAAARHAGVEVTVRRILLAAPLRELPGAERLSEPLCRHAARRLGVPVATTGVPLYTDARLYAEAGVPTVAYGAGPRSFLEANGHRADERLRLDDLKAATEIVACTLAEVLGR